MAVFPFCSLQTDARGMELAEHGSALFPVSCYDEDLVQTPVAWHWHEDLEILVITEGTAQIDTGTERLLLPRGQGLFINAGMLHSIHSSEDGPCALRSLVFHPRLAGGSADSIFWQNYIQPLVACIVAICWGMDSFNLVKGIAVVLIFGGVYLVTASRSRKEMEAYEAERQASGK